MSTDIRPLMVTTMGRSGSTLLMERLRQHPDILIAGSHPYEVKQFIYYGLALGVLTGHADRENSLHPDKMSTALNRNWIGRNPFNDGGHSPSGPVKEYWERQLPDIMARSFRHAILEYYDAERVAANKVRYRTFAEKIHPDPHMRAATRLLFPETAEILLMRDPRDMLCSYSGFWGTETQQNIKLIEHGMAQSSLINAAGVAHLVRYEDIINSEASTMAGIWKLLDLPSFDLLPASVNARHQTSGSTESSIGRWRRDLQPKTIEAIRHWEPWLEEFGYQPGFP